MSLCWNNLLREQNDPVAEPPHNCRKMYPVCGCATICQHDGKPIRREPKTPPQEVQADHPPSHTLTPRPDYHAHLAYEGETAIYWHSHPHSRTERDMAYHPTDTDLAVSAAAERIAMAGCTMTRPQWDALETAAETELRQLNDQGYAQGVRHVMPPPDDLSPPDERARNALLDAHAHTQAWLDILADDDNPRRRQKTMTLVTDARRLASQALDILEHARRIASAHK